MREWASPARPPADVAIAFTIGNFAGQLSSSRCQLRLARSASWIACACPLHTDDAGLVPELPRPLFTRSPAFFAPYRTLCRGAEGLAGPGLARVSQDEQEEKDQRAIDRAALRFRVWPGKSIQAKHFCYPGKLMRIYRV